MSKQTHPIFKGFIVGEGRSGTTLFSAILNRHSKLCITPETHFFQWLSLYPGGIKSFIHEYPDSLRKIFNRMDATSGWIPDPEPIIQKIPNITNKNQINQLFLMLGKSISNKFNKPFWLEKSPNHIRDINLIDSLSNNFLIIHIIRDGRSVAESLSRMNWASDSYIENCVRWLWTMQYYYRFLEKRNNVLTVRYEDLVIDPEPTLKKVCHFLGIEFELPMLKPNELDSYLIETGHKHKNKITGAIDPSNIDLWRKKVSSEEQQLADRLLGHELKKWGYSVKKNAFNKDTRMLVAPFVPDGETHPVIEKVLRHLMQEEADLWLDSAVNLGEKVTPPPRYWLHFDELLPHRLCKNTKYDSYLYFFKAIINLFLIKIKGTQLIFYYAPEHYNNCSWKMKKLLIQLTLKLANKILAPNNDYSDLEKNYHIIKESQRYNLSL